MNNIINMGDKYCGLGNIVKGVKKRKKKSDLGQRNYSFGYDDQLRTNESVHTLLSKLDIVDKKLEKFDQNHPLPTHQQGVLGNMDNCYPKLQVQLPENWLELMKECESHGKKPCLEVSVKSDCNCREESQKGATYSRQEENNRSRSDRRSCSCEKARRNVLDTCCSSTYQRRANYLDDRRDEYPTRSSNNRQYGLVESSLPCGEPPNQIPPLTSLCGATSELSEFAPTTSSKINRLHCRPRIPEMEPRCEEFDEEADYPDNNQLATSELSKFAPATSTKKNWREYDAEDNAPYNSDCRLWKASSKCREFQSNPCPSCRTATPINCCRDATQQNDSEVIGPSRIKNRALKEYNKCDTSPNCLCAQAICMIQNCSNRKQRKCSQQSGPSHADEPAYKKPCCTIYGNCESQFSTLVVNIPRTPIVTSSPADESSCIQNVVCGFQGNGKVEFGRITPIKSCECDTKKDIIGASQSPQQTTKSQTQDHDDAQRYSTNSHEEPGQLEKECSVPPKKNSHHENDETDDKESHHKPKTTPGRKDSKGSHKCGSYCVGDHHHTKWDSPKTKSKPQKQDDPGSQSGNTDLGRASKDESPQTSKATPERQNVRGSQSGDTDPSSASKDESPRKPKATPGEQDVRGSQSGHKDPSRASKDASPQKAKTTESEGARGSQSGKTDSSGASKEASPRSRNSTPEDQKLENDGAKGAASEKEKANSSSDGKVEFSLVMKNEVKFEGQGESETPINLPEKQRLTFPTSDLPSAPLLLLRRGFVQMPQASLTPSETNLNNSKECDLRSCSIRRSPQRDLYIGEGTILTSHPSNISMHNEFLTVPKAAFTPQSSRIKPITDSETQTPRDSKKHNNDSLDKYKLQEHRETERSKEEKQLLTKIQNIDKTKPKLTNLEPPEKMKDIKVKWNEALSSASGKFLDQPWQRHEGDLRTPQFSPDVTFWNVPSSEPQWVQQRNNPEPDRRAKSRGRKNTSSRPTRSNSLNSGKSFARICNSERERIHKLARKCLKKRSPSRSLGEKSTISSTNKETKNNYGSVSQSFAPPESENRGASNLNQKYLKELIFPFAHKGPELLEQDESGTQKNVQKFVIERIIRINPCSRDIVEASQHSDTDEDKEEEEEEEFGPRNTTTILEAFIGSKPAISGTSTCPTGYAPSAGSRAVSDLFRDTFMRFCGTEEDGRSEDNLLFHTFPNFDDPSDQPRDIFDDASGCPPP